MFMNTGRFRAFAAFIVSAMLAACGGGGTRSIVAPPGQDYRQGGQLRITPQSVCFRGGLNPCGSLGPCGIYSSTVASAPYNTPDRTTVAVNEQVNMSTDFGAVWWVIGGDGWISDETASNPYYTARETPGTETVFVRGIKGSCDTQSITFNVVAPTVGYYFDGRRRHQYNRADIGMENDVYALPNNVNFYNTYVEEKMANESATGVWDCINNKPHENYPVPSVGTGFVYPQGTQMTLVDRSYSGWCDVDPYQGGYERVDIPIEYAVTPVGVWHDTNTVSSISTATAAGALTRSKDHSGWNTNVGDPQVWEF